MLCALRLFALRLFLNPVATVLIAVTAPDVASAQQSTPATIAIQGRVLSVDGEPLSGRAKLWLGDTKYEARLGTDGKFDLRDVPFAFAARMHGSVEGGALMIEPDGLAPIVLSPPLVAAGATADLGDLIAPLGTVVRGQVLTADAKPVSGAKLRVELYHSYLASTIYKLRDETYQTDASGWFETNRLPCGEYLAIVEVPGFEHTLRFGKIDGSLARMELQPIQLREEFPVSVTVRDLAGIPMEAVQLSYNGGNGKTERDGKFKIRGLSGDYRIQVRASAEGYRSVNGIHEGKSQIDLRLEPSHALICSLVDAKSEAPVKLQQAIMCTYTLDANGEPKVSGCRNPQFQQIEPGKYQVTHFGALRYHLLLKAEGYHDRELFLDPLDADRDWDIGEIRLEPASMKASDAVVTQSVSGVVRRNGKAVRNATVSLWGRDRPIDSQMNAPLHLGRLIPPRARFRAATVTSADGAYNIALPYQGDWLLRVDVEGQAPAFAGPQTFERGEDARRDIELVAGGEIAGDVKNIEHFSGGVLRAIAFDDRGFIETAQITRDGDFKFAFLAPGTYGVKIGHFGMQDREVTSGGESKLPAPDPWLRVTKVEVKAGETVEIEPYANFN